MKATLEFTLPEEHREHLMAAQAAEMTYAMADFKHQLRQWLKHGHEFQGADEALHKVSEMAHELFDGFDI
jgi:hypothetical protein